MDPRVAAVGTPRRLNCAVARKMQTRVLQRQESIHGLRTCTDPAHAMHDEWGVCLGSGDLGGGGAVHYQDADGVHVDRMDSVEGLGSDRVEEMERTLLLLRGGRAHRGTFRAWVTPFWAEQEGVLPVVE